MSAAAFPRTPSCVLADSRPHDRHPSRRDADKAAARAECQLTVRFDDYLLPGLQVYLAAGFGQLCGAGLNVLASGDGQMVIGLDFRSAVGVGAVVLAGDSGVKGYYGANPPAGHGPHRYLYAVHAVDTELPAEEIANPTKLGFNLNFHALGRAIIWGWYENQ